jgi:hypothetical protein
LPDYQFTFAVHDITPQKATVIRDRLNTKLGEEQVTVTTSTMAQTTSLFRVIGVDTNTREVFDQTTEATDKDTAAQQVIGTNPDRIVALVRTQTP